MRRDHHGVGKRCDRGVGPIAGPQVVGVLPISEPARVGAGHENSDGLRLRVACEGVSGRADVSDTEGRHTIEGWPAILRFRRHTAAPDSLGDPSSDLAADHVSAALAKPRWSRRQRRPNAAIGLEDPEIDLLLGIEVGQGAEWLTDDPVARFLEHSEWGVAPYEDQDYSPPWLIAPIGEWPGDFSLQARHLVRVLARFTLRWDVEQWPGVTVSTNLRQPDTIIELRYDYRDDNGAILDTEKRVIRATDLRGSSPYSVAVTPKKYSPVQKNVAIVVEATYVAHNGAEPEELTAVLMAEGHGISGKVDHVS